MKSLLIVEDDILIVTVLKRRLGSEGYEIIVANNGLEAKEIIENKVPDLVISDLMMPHLSGLELIELIRNQLDLTTPIIVLSAAGQEDTVLQAFEMGANDFISKPFSINELLMRIKKLL
ncbi:MAG: response regulator transcription factor [Bacteroidales bacterium]